MPGVEQVETAAQGGYGIVPGTMAPSATVWHCMEGWLSTMRLWAAETLGPDGSPHHAVSYHFGLSLSGDIVQFVPIFTPAWHAGRLDDVPPTWSGHRKDVNPNAHTIGVAAEGFYNAPDVWNDAQTTAAIRVQHWIAETTKVGLSVETVIGHREIAPVSRANDPGPHWEKAKIILGSKRQLPPMPSVYDPRTFNDYALAIMGRLGRRLTPKYEDDHSRYFELKLPR